MYGQQGPTHAAVDMVHYFRKGFKIDLDIVRRSDQGFVTATTRIGQAVGLLVLTRQVKQCPHLASRFRD